MRDLETDQPEWSAQEYAAPSRGLAPESPIGELEEMELAMELLGATSERELDRFLGGLLRKAASAAGASLKSSTGRALGGFLKGTVKKALPAVGRATDNYFAPGRGGETGSQIGAGAGRMLGLELEGLSHEDQEFEVAKRLVRLAGAATGSAVAAPQSLPPAQVARQAVSQAAREHAPGLLKPDVTAGHGGCHCNTSNGHWERRGREIVLHGL